MTSSDQSTSLLKHFPLSLSQNIWESHLWLLCLCSLSKYIRDSRSRFLEYSSSISDSLLKNSCKSAKNRTLPSVLWSKLFTWSTRICRTSGKDSVKQIPLHLRSKNKKIPHNLSRRSTAFNGKQVLGKTVDKIGILKRYIKMLQSQKLKYRSRPIVTRPILYIKSLSGILGAV